MGLFKKRREAEVAKTALQEARDPGSNPGAIQDLVQKILNVGIDGKAQFAGSEKMAALALRKSGGDKEKAIDWIRGDALRKSTALGFATNLGGFITMPIAIPVNLFEFYVQAIRSVGAIAHLRGYDVRQQDVRTASLITLAGSHADDILKKAGLLTLGGGSINALLRSKLPPAALMMLNKAVGFRVLRGVGERVLSRLGRGIPLVGGLIGGALDGWMMRQILATAEREFPQAR